MVSGHVPAMRWHWQSWRRTRANLRAQRTLQKPAGAEGPAWSTHTPPLPSGGLWADRESGLRLASPPMWVTLWNISSCCSPCLAPQAAPLSSPSGLCPPALHLEWYPSARFPSRRPAVSPRCATSTVSPPRAPRTMAQSESRPL